MAGESNDQADKSTNAAVIQPQVFNCLGCSAPLKITALGVSNTIVCGKCQTIIDIGHPIYKVIGAAKKLIQTGMQGVEPKIPLGSFGFIRDHKWKVIGYMIRMDVKYSVEWREYLLYNPFLGYRFLFEMDDHYSMIRRLTYDPIGVDFKTLTEVSSFTLESMGEFKIFNKGDAVVLFVVGEFFWKVKTGEKVLMEDYVYPPYMISLERTKDEINFSIGEYIPAEEIRQAFAQANGFIFTPPWTIFQNQVNPYKKNYKFNLSVWGFALVGLFVILVLSSATQKTSRIERFELDHVKLKGNQNNTFVSPSFEIKDNFGNVEAEIYAPLRNQWLEAEINLVNEKTGADYSTETGVEYYSGSDYDGSWSEGSLANKELISAVPAGTYHLELLTQSDMPERQVSLMLMRHGSMALNFFICLLLLSLFPLWMIWRHRSFEISRWENSDFSPYFSHSDQEDSSYDEQE